MDTDIPLEQREKLAESGLVAVETDDGATVPISTCFVCPDACGKVFRSEDFYKKYCPTDCEAQLGYLKKRMEQAEQEEVFTVFILFDKERHPLKVCDDLSGVMGYWWWRNVAQMIVKHYATQQEAEESQERILQTLRPLYDLQPNTVGEVGGFSDLPPDPEDVAKTEPVAFKVSPEEDLRISVAAEKAGLSRSEWLRRAVRMAG